MHSDMRRIGWLALALVVGCSNSPLDESADDLEEARARWAQQGIADYRFDVATSCFCMFEATLPITVTVVNGVPTSTIYADSGVAAPPQFSDGKQTVPQLFDLIAERIARKPAELVVTYDPALGYPVSIRLDMDRKMADDELRVTVANFQPIP